MNNAAVLTEGPLAQGESAKTFSGRIVRALVVTLTVVAFALALITFGSSTLPALLGHKTMIVTSGSMEPTVRVGDVAVIDRQLKNASHIQNGDIITFQSVDGQGMVTHRVLSVREINGRPYFQTKGDANTVADPNLVPIEAVYGKVSLSLPKAGYLLHFVSSRLGTVVMIMLPLIVLMAFEVGNLIADVRRRPAWSTTAEVERGIPHGQAVKA